MGKSDQNPYFIQLENIKSPQYTYQTIFGTQYAHIPCYQRVVYCMRILKDRFNIETVSIGISPVANVHNNEAVNKIGHVGLMDGNKLPNGTPIFHVPADGIHNYRILKFTPDERGLINDGQTICALEPISTDPDATLEYVTVRNSGIPLTLGYRTEQPPSVKEIVQWQQNVAGLLQRYREKLEPGAIDTLTHQSISLGIERALSQAKSPNEAIKLVSYEPQYNRHVLSALVTILTIRENWAKYLLGCQQMPITSLREWSKEVPHYGRYHLTNNSATGIKMGRKLMAKISHDIRLLQQITQYYGRRDPELYEKAKYNSIFSKKFDLMSPFLASRDEWFNMDGSENSFFMQEWTKNYQDAFRSRKFTRG